MGLLWNDLFLLNSFRPQCSYSLPLNDEKIFVWKSSWFTFVQFLENMVFSFRKKERDIYMSVLFCVLNFSLWFCKWQNCSLPSYPWVTIIGLMEVKLPKLIKYFSLPLYISLFGPAIPLFLFQLTFPQPQPLIITIPLVYMNSAFLEYTLK